MSQRMLPRRFIQKFPTGWDKYTMSMPTPVVARDTTLTSPVYATHTPYRGIRIRRPVVGQALTTSQTNFRPAGLVGAVS